VFCTTKGGEPEATNVRRSLRQALAVAGLPINWTPRELRHGFVSIMSAEGASSEPIAKLVGHATTKTAERVYRRSCGRSSPAARRSSAPRSIRSAGTRRRR
jgi:integrase